MNYIAGIDIGNSSTEVAIFRRTDGEWSAVSSSLYRTTGLKGTTENIPGIRKALERAVGTIDSSMAELDLLLLNEAAPVIGDVAMETITETVVTESTMIGHDPSTPGGGGFGRGVVVDIHADPAELAESVVVLVPSSVDFARAAGVINEWSSQGTDVQAAIMQNDDGVLVANRIGIEIPIVDEVREIEEIPMGQPAAVEVAPSGRTIDQLSNPYGIATAFDLSPEETQKIIPVARALVGNKSAVVIETPKGNVEERAIPAGSVRIIDGNGNSLTVDTDEGADAIMDAVETAWPITDVEGERGTNIGGMLSRARGEMAEITDQDAEAIRIRDLLAVNTLVPTEVAGAVAGEHRMEHAVGLASMVKTSALPMAQIAEKLESTLDTEVRIQGIEASMAVLGSLTTPGTDVPMALLDMGGGSTDAAFIDEKRTVDSTHLAGAGDMVTMLIDSELGLDDRSLAERLKQQPLAKVQTLYSARHEDGTVHFFDEAISSDLFGRVVTLGDDGSMEVVPTDHTVEEIRSVRRAAKESVFLTNARRALKAVTPSNSIRQLPFVVMVGRSALDFEIPEMISDELAEYGVVCGRGNVRGAEGPRNAVATGLVLSAIGGGEYLEFAIPEEMAAPIEGTVGEVHE